MGKPNAVLDPKNELYVQYRLRFDGSLRAELKNEGYGNLGWVTDMEHKSMLSSIEDSKERNKMKQTILRNEARNYQRALFVTRNNPNSVKGSQRAVLFGTKTPFRNNLVFQSPNCVSLFAILYGAQHRHMFHLLDPPQIFNSFMNKLQTVPRFFRFCVLFVELVFGVENRN